MEKSETIDLEGLRGQVPFLYNPILVVLSSQNLGHNFNYDDNKIQKSQSLSTQ